jgi:uncharacterized membrane protein YfcA
MKRMILVLTAALLLAVMTVAVAPAMAQEQKKEETKAEEKKGEDKDKAKDEKGKDLPKSGGLPVNGSLLGLGAGALIVGGGLVALKVVRQGRH